MSIMITVKRSTLHRFAVLDCIFWGFFAAYSGFVAAYLLKQGLSGSMLSIAFAVYMVTSFAGAFFWGGLCDRFQSSKRVFLPEFLATIILAVAIYFLGKIHYLLGTLLFPVYGFFASPLGSLVDAWMIRAFHRDAALYAQARSIGSAGYAFVMLFAGILIQRFGFGMMLGVALPCAFFTIWLAFRLPEPQENGAQSKHMSVSGEHPRVNYLELFKIRPYVFTLVILLFTGLAISPYNNLKIVFLEHVGGDVSMLGLDSFFGVMAQAFFIFYSGRMSRISPYRRLVIMALAVMATLVLALCAVHPWMIICGTVFGNISYGIMLPTIRQMTEQNVHGQLKNSAHSLTDATFGNVSGVLALSGSSFLMAQFGTRAVMLVSLLVICIPVALSALEYRRRLARGEA